MGYCPWHPDSGIPESSPLKGSPAILVYWILGILGILGMLCHPGYYTGIFGIEACHTKMILTIKLKQD
jgi:hypothetical protein